MDRKPVKLRYFTAAFNAGIEFALSIIDQLNDSGIDYVEDFQLKHRPAQIPDAVAALNESKIDEEELRSVVESLDAVAFKVNDPSSIGPDNPDDVPRQLEVVPKFEALRIYAECVPIDQVVSKALFPPKPDGYLIKREGSDSWLFIPTLPMDPHKAGISAWRTVFASGIEVVTPDDDCPF
jgi:hypothetical protein